MPRTHELSSAGSGGLSRRGFLKHGGRLAAGATLASSAIPPVHAGEDNAIRLALIGSGNRGSGAVRNALLAPGGPVKLYVMADINERKMRIRVTFNVTV